MKLVIFDLDQTLVNSLPVHMETVRRLFMENFHIDASLTGIDFSGRSLGDNIVALAGVNGIDADSVRRRMGDLLDSYQRIFSLLLPRDGRKYVLPGVISLLQKLTDSGEFLVLYTGDSPIVADRVLSVTGLQQYFRFATYGTEARSRLDMARSAVTRAESMAGRGFSAKDVVVVGDSLRDVDCGRQLGAVAIGVATGVNSMEELKNRGADYVFKDFSDTGRVVEAMENGNARHLPLEKAS